MDKLSQEDVEEKLALFPEWSQVGDSLQRTYSFNDFPNAVAFVHRVAELAEECQHHPDILVRYNKVTLTLTTHDAGGLTDKDFQFAQSMDACTTAS